MLSVNFPHRVNSHFIPHPRNTRDMHSRTSHFHHATSNRTFGYPTYNHARKSLGEAVILERSFVWERRLDAWKH
ncbi:hypothetical protein ABKN59_001525 [Abortiporus biennis]